MIELDEFVERLCRIGADRGPRAFPRKKRDREIAFKSILLLLDSARTYDEDEINELIERWKREVAPAIHTDFVTIRRLLVDYGHLERTADGGSYRVGFPRGAVAFELDVDEVDLRATVAAYVERERERRQEREKKFRDLKSS